MMIYIMLFAMSILQILGRS